MTFLEPNADIAFFILRLVVAVIFLAHGPTKLQNTAQKAQGMGLNTAQLSAIGIIETLGAAALILGVWVQPFSAALAVIMLGAIYFKSQKWGKSFTGDGGWEFEFLILAAALTILLGAPATYALF